MKKILISLLLCAVILNLSISLAFAEREDAKIIYLKGQVKLQSVKEVRWIVAKEGMVIKKGDRIKTFKFSSVEIAIDKEAKNVIRIEEESELLLDKIIDKRAQLFKGKVFALLGALEPGSSFEVRTPTAVCGVAGSGIFVDTNENKTTAGCHEDKAYAKGIRKDGSLTPERVIKHGYKCVIEKFKAPGPLAALTRHEQREWSGFRESLREHRELLKGKKRKEPRKIIDSLKDLEDKADLQREDRQEDRLEKMEQKKREDAEPEPTTGGGY